MSEEEQFASEDAPEAPPSPRGEVASPREARPETHARRPRLLNQVSAFNYVTVPGAPTYRAIMQAFYEAKQHYAIELRPTDVVQAVNRGGLHAELQGEEDVEYHLGQLVEWGNLTRGHDATAVTRIEDFYRKRYVFHLSAVGEAAHRAVQEVEATVGKSGSLQTTMLVKIRDALTALARAASAATVEPRVLAACLHDLHTSFDTLTREATRFIGELNRHLGTDRMEEQRFTLYKQAVLAYVSHFVEELQGLAEEIVAGIQAVSRADVEVLLHAAVLSADLPPALAAEGIDPVGDWIEEQRARWKGMCVWFLGEPPATAPTVERLAGVAVQAVVGLTRTLGRLNERRSRRIDRAADFRTLARWFAACEDDLQAHRLWQAAFGLHAARHFHLEEEDAERVSPGTSWWDAAPVSVPVRLRTRGSISSAGQAAPAQDHSRARRWIAQLRQRERAQLDVALRRFSGRGALRFSDVATLDAAQFDLLLALLDEALSSPRTEEGTRRTRTADGRLTVTLVDPAGPEPRATLQTPRGRLSCLNYRIAVVENGAVRVAVSG